MEAIKMTPQQLATAMIAAVLAFKQKWEADLAVEEQDRLLMTEEQRAETANDVLPAEMEGQEWWEHFMDYVAREGLEKFLASAGADLKCFASLKKGEPSFTLRGQDITASILVRHWLALQQLAPVEAESVKLDKAEGIAEAMEDYQPQKWPD